MEASFAASALLHPVGLAILALVIFATVSLSSQAGHPDRRIPKRKLVQGFVGLFLGALLLAAVSSYVSPEEARRFGVQEANYIGALWRQFVTLGVLVIFASVVGCAVVGVPLIVALASRGLATVPIVVAASVPISLAFGFAVGMVRLGNSHLFQEVLFLSGAHAFLALTFTVGAQLPWRGTRATAA